MLQLQSCRHHARNKSYTIGLFCVPAYVPNTRITHILTQFTSNPPTNQSHPLDCHHSARRQRHGNVKFVENCRIRFIIKKFFDAISSSESSESLSTRTDTSTLTHTHTLCVCVRRLRCVRMDIRQLRGMFDANITGRAGLHTHTYTQIHNT